MLLADLATETLNRLRTSEYDTTTRRQLSHAIGRTGDLMTFTVPLTDCALVERDSSRPDPLKGGDDFPTIENYYDQYRRSDYAHDVVIERRAVVER